MGRWRKFTSDMVALRGTGTDLDLLGVYIGNRHLTTTPDGARQAHDPGVHPTARRRRSRISGPSPQPRTLSERATPSFHIFKKHSRADEADWRGQFAVCGVFAEFEGAMNRERSNGIGNG
jgi:hypothetical protein